MAITDLTPEVETALQSAVTQIADRCLLVHLSFSYWTGKAADSRVAHVVEQNENAASGVVRATKSLVDEKYIKDIMRHVTALRKHVNVNTVPWAASGGRLMPADKIPDFMQKFQEIRSQFDGAVDDLVDDYMYLQNEARRTLGGMFDPSLYPPEEELTKRFDVRLSITEVPIGTDFRFNMPTEIREELEHDLQRAIGSSVDDIKEDLIARCAAPLKALHARLADKDTKRFAKSLFDNIADVADIVDSLNFMDDPDVRQAVRALRGVSDIDRDDVKNVPGTQEYAAKRLESVSNLGVFSALM